MTVGSEVAARVEPRGTVRWRAAERLLDLVVRSVGRGRSGAEPTS